MSKSNAGLVAIAIKLGPKLVTLLTKLIGKLKLGKLAFAGASLGSYAFLYTWHFAILIITAISIHEAGHVWAMKRCGVKTKGFYLIPFVGGAAVAEEAFPSKEAEVFIALMGPVWGLCTAVVPAIIYVFTSDPFWAAASAWIAMINLFNLLPIHPLDGGRVMRCVAFSFNLNINWRHLIVYSALAVPMLVWVNSGLFVFIFLIGMYDMLSDMRAIPRDRRILEQNKAQRIKLFSTSKVHYDVLNEIIPKEEKRLAPLPRPAMKLGLSWYGGLIVVLLLLMYSMANIPGADIAVQFLNA